MRIAMPLWEGRISPLFDVARKLLVVEIEDGQERKRWEVPLQEEWPPFRAQRLAGLQVHVLICGGISRALAEGLQTLGISVISQIKGQPDQILAAYLSGRLATSRFAMPGSAHLAGSLP